MTPDPIAIEREILQQISGAHDQKNSEKALAVGMAEKAKECVATGSEMYHGNLPDGWTEHH